MLKIGALFLLDNNKKVKSMLNSVIQNLNFFSCGYLLIDLKNKKIIK